MPVEPDPRRVNGERRSAAAREAARRAATRLDGAITDFFVPGDARLDDRIRLAISQSLNAIVRLIETDMRRHAARTLARQDRDAQAEALLGSRDDIVGRLDRAGLLRDRRLMDELIARARGDLIADALPPDPVQDAPGSLLVLLTEAPDGVVAGAAKALLIAESRRRSARQDGVAVGNELPAELHHRLVWWIAASVREAALAVGVHDAATDRAIVDAAERSLAAHDEGERVEALAMRLAIALDARANELPALLTGALADRRLTLFTALLGGAVDLDYEGARGIVLEPEGDRLWLALRAADLDRATIARIGFALAEADARRDVERFADDLDDIAAVPAATARSALAPLTLHHDLRVAIDALAREDRR